MLNNLNFFDVLPKTSYNEECKNHVVSFIMDYFCDSKTNNIYFVANNKLYGYNKNEGILVIQKILEILPNKLEKNQLVKIIRILIYLPTKFPSLPPKFYLERAEDFSLVDLNTDVNKNTYEIVLKTIADWKSVDDYLKIMKEIKNSFTKIYPIYKLEIHKRKNIIYPENSYLPKNAVKISLDSNDQNINKDIPNNFEINIQPNNFNINIPNNTNNNIQNNFNNIIQNKNIINLPNFENKENFTDEEVKKILIDHTISNIKEKFLSTYYENKNIRIKIDNLKLLLNNNLSELGDKISEGNKIISTFDKILKDINIEKANIKDDIIKSSSINVSFENYKEFVKIPNKDEVILKLLAMEACSEEFLSYVKRFYEKNIIELKDSMRYIRQLSKEIFFINFVKKKMMDQ